MAKKTTTSKQSGGNVSITDLLCKFDNDAEIIEDSQYANIDEWIPTGSYILNATLSGSIFGGMPNRRSICLAGESGSGKTYIALSICRNAISMGYDIIYCDSEGAVDIETVKRIGIDTRKFVIKPVGTVEEFATFSANMVKNISEITENGGTPPKIMVVLDSLGNLASNKEKGDVIDGTGKRDMTKQQLIRSTFRVVGNDFAKLGIPFIICNHTYECCLKDTLVLMSDGTLKPIQDISKGEFVQTQYGDKEVLNNFEHNTVNYYHLVFEDGSELKCTPNHQLLVHRDGVEEWVAAVDLLVDDEIICH